MMQILKVIRRRYKWVHPVSVILCIGCYVLILRPLRVLINEDVQLPFFQWILEDHSRIQISADMAGTGVLFHVPAVSGGGDLIAVIAVPAGLVFILALIGLILITSSPRYFILLPATHVICYVAALLSGVLAGFTSPLMIHFVTLFQQYLLPAVSFAILFMALWEIKNSVQSINQPHL